MGLPDDPAAFYITGKAGASDKELLSSVTEALATAQSGAQAYTASEIVTMRVKSSDGTAFRTITPLQIIAPARVAVSGIVIATTLTTLMAYQTHQIGLLRCVGATRRQVVGSVLRTALLTGLAGSVAGVVVGAVIAVPVIGSGLIEEIESRHLTISRASFVLAALVGTVVTMVSVLRSAHQASRVSALVALTEQTVGHESLGRRRVAAVVVGAVVAALDLGLIHGGVAWRVLETIGTGAIAAILGIILALSLFVVGTSRLVGPACGQECRPILHLATRNLARNSGRVAATTAPLLVAVAAAATMSGGLSSVASSIQTYVGYRTPVDITVGELSVGQDPSLAVARITAAGGVRGVVPVPRLEVTMTGSRQKDQKEALTVSAADAKTVSPVPRSREALETLNDQVLLLDRTYDIADGAPVALTGPADDVDLTVRVREGPDAAVTPVVAGRLVGNAPIASLLWVRADGDGPGRAPVSVVRRVVAGNDLFAGDSQEGRTNLTDQVRQASIATGTMLVLILLTALSGLVNIIDISVLKCTREIRVLRAAGTQRSEIRRLLIAEAVLIVFLGGTIGILLGCGVSIMGVAAPLTTDSASFLAVPVPQLVLVLIGILLMLAAIGILASLRPAESVGRIPSVHVLAQD